MAVVDELIRIEDNGTLSFGNYNLDEKSKKSDFEFKGDLYKVKTYKDITKLEKNGMFAYESVPGTAVNNYKFESTGVSFDVDVPVNAQITVGLEEETEYVVYIDGVNAGSMNTNLSGKLSLSVPASNGASVKIVKE
ncbi:MAG: endosialidase [Lachnospiraceae bacterium]|nr:endosialidase [Lachnospiraceae bacterium]